MAGQFIGTEATGVYVGTLVEDMIDTVTREKKLYCNVHIPQFFTKNTNYPLTYVPFWAMLLPLKKNDKVMVEFHQGNLMYPVLYKNPSEIDRKMYEQFNIPNGVIGGKINKPTAQKTVGAFRLGQDSYVIKTDYYTLFHQNDGYILIDKTNKIYINGTEVNISATSKFNLDAGVHTEMFSPTGTFKIGNNALTLGIALSEMASAIDKLIETLGQILVTGGTTVTWYTEWVAQPETAMMISEIKELIAAIPLTFDII